MSTTLRHEHEAEDDADARLRKMQRERYSALVHEMFSPGTFRHGIKLENMQFALMRLIALSRSDLNMWLDLFEQQWLHERVAAIRELERSAGKMVDKSESVDHIELQNNLLQLQAEENVEDDNLQIQVTPLGAIQFSDERNKAERIATLWLRFILRLKNGGVISLFKIKALRPLLEKRNARSRQLLQTELELHKTLRLEEQAKRKAAEASLI